MLAAQQAHVSGRFTEMAPARRSAIRQLRYLLDDYRRPLSGRWWRALPVLFSHSFVAITAYRLSRASFLLLGPAWKVIHLLIAPVRFLFRPWTGGCDIHYKANIAGGLIILHPALGVVISKYAVIGRNCSLAGGNCVGGKGPGHKLHHGAIRIGDDVELGINAVVLGPITVGDRAIIGAGSVALHDIAGGVTVGGIPAQPLPTTGARRSPPMRLSGM